MSNMLYPRYQQLSTAKLNYYTNQDTTIFNYSATDLFESSFTDKVTVDKIDWAGKVFSPAKHSDQYFSGKINISEELLELEDMLNPDFA